MHPLAPLPTLDAHTHLGPARALDELAGIGTVLAMTLSLEETGQVIQRPAGLVVWGVGCHPREAAAQAAFDPGRFAELAAGSALIGEIGLDGSSRVPMDRQLATFRQALEFAARQPRIVSIHSYRATGAVLAELRRTPVAAPILHWWTGSAAETEEAVALGCYFSIHSAVARHTKFRTLAPRERILIESDQGWSDPPDNIPRRIERVEQLLAGLFAMPGEQVRGLAWRNLAAVVQQTGTAGLLPGALLDIFETLPLDEELTDAGFRA